MAARSYGGCSLTTAQESALSAVGITSVNDTSCTASDLNTCALRAIYEKTGTYFQSGNTITVTIANHGLSTGSALDLMFTTGESTNGRYTITVVDSNTFTVTTISNLRKGNFFTTESGGTNTFTVRLNTRPTADVTVTITGLDVTEGSLSPTALTFTEDNWYTPQTVTVTGINDSDPDGDIFYTLIATASNTGGYTGTETATITIVNQENETPGTLTTTTTPVVNQDSDTPGIVITLTGTLITSGDVKASRTIRDATELISFYPLYDPAKGAYTTWGDIDLPWDEVNSLDGIWQVAEYTDSNSYVVGDEVIRIEDDGYRLVVYVATSNVPVPAGNFNPSLWSEICHIVTSEPVGLPEISDLLEKYEYYNPEKYLATWSEAGEEWNVDLNSDEWGEYKIEKQYFYRSSDVVLYDTRCGTFTCAYVATQDMPANNELIVPGPPPADYWQKLYCVKNDKEDKCEKRVTCDQPNRELVSLSSGDTDLICVPVESRVGG